MTRVLILGGTTEASALGRALAAMPGVEATMSFAGRTSAPVRHAIPTRIGGFGGVEGLATWMRDQGTERLIDATHPFAARISANAVAAARTAGVPLLRIERPAWRPGPGNDWTELPDVAGAVAALGAHPRRVFLTVGRLELAAFAKAPHHHYLVRTIDTPAVDDLPPDHALLLDRGPYTLAGETELMRRHGVDVLVTKNSGGEATRAKLDAARDLGLPVLLVARPVLPPAETVETVEEALVWIAGDPHGAPPPSARRGV
jgi:precorrin-6A/cobalt-precorrin-6A reductase